MKTILLLSIYLSLLFHCALSNRHDLDGAGFRLLADLNNEEQLQSEEESMEFGCSPIYIGETFEESQLEEETQLEEEENIMMVIPLPGEDGENTLFAQTFWSGTSGSVISDGCGFVAAVFDDGSSVDIDGGGCESSTASTEPISTGSSELVNGIDDFTDITTFANVWSYEQGPSLNGLYYVTDLPANLRMEGGFLYIDALKEAYQGVEYTSASIFTQGKISVQYGLFIIKAKFSYTKGVYPLYMLISDDLSCSVVVMGGGISPNTIFSQVFTPSGSSTPANYTLPSGTTDDDFHYYSVTWYPSGMDFYVDDILYSSINATMFGGQWPFDMFSMFLNLQLAVGGPPGNPDDSSVFPQEFVVDAVGILQG